MRRINWTKEIFINILLLIVGIFCLINLFTHIDETIYVISNLIALGVIIYYFLKFEKEKIHQIIQGLHLWRPLVTFFKKNLWHILLYIFILLLITPTVGNFLEIPLTKNCQGLFFILTMLCGSAVMTVDKKNRKLIFKTEKTQSEKTLQLFSNKYSKTKKRYTLKTMTEWIKIEGFWYSLLLFGIIGLGVFLRFYNLGKLGLTFDEGTSWLATEQILKTGVPEMPSGFNYFRSLPYFYLNAIIVYFWGFSEFTVRILSVFSSLVLTFFIYKLLKLLQVSKGVILLGVSFLSLHYWVVTLSRWNRMYILAITFAVIALYYFLRYISDKKNKFILISTISAILAIFTHNTGYVVFLFIPLYIILDFKIFSQALLKDKFKLLIPFLFLLFAKVLTTYIAINSQTVATVEPIKTNMLDRFIQSFHLFLDINFAVPSVIFEYFNFFLPFSLLGFFIFLRSKSPSKKLVLFLPLVIILLTHLYEDKYFIGGRILFFEFIFLLIGTLVTLSYLNLRLKNLFVGTLTIILIMESGIFVPFLEYGDKVNTKYSTSYVLPFYPDNKSFAVELNRLVKDNDLILFFGVPINSYPYLQDIATKQIYQVTKKNNGSSATYLNHPCLTSQEEIFTLIENSRGTVYLVLTFSSLSYSQQAPYLYHFRPSLYRDVLTTYDHEIIFESTDGVSTIIKIIK